MAVGTGVNWALFFGKGMEFWRESQYWLGLKSIQVTIYSDIEIACGVGDVAVLLDNVISAFSKTPCCRP